jgi:hypothetical protein
LLPAGKSCRHRAAARAGLNSRRVRPHCAGKTDTYSNDTIRGDHDASTAAACLSGLRLLAG